MLTISALNSRIKKNSNFKVRPKFQMEENHSNEKFVWSPNPEIQSNDTYHMFKSNLQTARDSGFSSK